MTTPLARTAFAFIALLAFDTHLLAQTWTAIMSGESSQAFHFENYNSTPRTTVTSIQSPFAFPASNIPANDTQTFPTGTGSGTPPYWFYYSGAGATPGTLVTQDLTGTTIQNRPPSYGQTSAQKSSMIGFRAKAAFAGSASGTSGTAYEVIYFSERPDWAGMREFGVVRQMNPGVSQDITYFYWSVNSNCTANGNMGFPYCRPTQAVSNAQESPTSASLIPEYLTFTTLSGLTAGTQYYFNCYLFWANWDSTYKFRVEAWDSTYSTQITAFNVDTSSGGVNFGLTTGGANGYITMATQRADPSNALTSTGIQLSVASIEMVQ